MDLIVRGKVIKGNIEDILNRLSYESNKPYFKKKIPTYDKYNNILTNCPHHKQGQEAKPSCYIVGNNKSDVEFGKLHCFSCGISWTLPQLVGYCFDKDVSFGEEWLLEKYGGDSSDSFLPEIQLVQDSSYNIIDEDILSKYKYYHPYMWERKLSKEIVDKFSVGYDPETKSLTFPVWDEHNNLVLITRRSVESKLFHIDKNGKKPVYLLNYIMNNNITTSLITEAQIDALTAWGYGFPCCATMGSPSKEQIDSINKSGIRHLICMFDNDESGRKFTNTICKEIKEDILVSTIYIRGNKKDINDLTKEEFWGYLKEIGVESN